MPIPKWPVLLLSGWARATSGIEPRDRYAAIKRDLARRYANNRPAYTAGKAAIIGEILGRAAPTR